LKKPFNQKRNTLQHSLVNLDDDLFYINGTLKASINKKTTPQREFCCIKAKNFTCSVIWIQKNQ